MDKILGYNLFVALGMIFNILKNYFRRDKMKIARLKNGSEEVESLVTVTMIALKSLLNTNPMVLYELNEKCKNSERKFFNQAMELALRDLALIGVDGKVHNSIKNIVLSAIIGEGISLALVSPIAD